MKNLKSKFTKEASALAEEIEKELHTLPSSDKAISRLLKTAKKVSKKGESKKLSGVIKKLEELLQNTNSSPKKSTKRENKIDYEKKNFILFKAGGSEPIAIDAAHVFRLEEIDTNFAELVDDLPVLPYRDKKLRLARLNDEYEINITPDETGACKQKAIIIDHNEHSLVLAVQEFMELVTAPFRKEESQGSAFCGKVKLNNKEFDVINTDHLLNLVFSNDNADEVEEAETKVEAKIDPQEEVKTEKRRSQFKIEVNFEPMEEIQIEKPQKIMAAEPAPKSEPKQKAEPVKAKRVLFVAPKKSLSLKAIEELNNNHHEVVHAINAMAAILILREDTDFDLFIFDIETSDVNGLELGEACRGDDAIKHIPILAITTKKSSYWQEQAKKFGIKNFCNRASYKKISELTKKLALKTERKIEEMA